MTEFGPAMIRLRVCACMCVCVYPTAIHWDISTWKIKFSKVIIQCGIEGISCPQDVIDTA